MKRPQLTLVAPIVAISLLMTTMTSQADTALPHYYPKSFAVFGVLSGLDTRSQTLTINDHGQRYDINIRVHTLNSQFSNLQALRPGMTIGASVAGERVTEIWVLPKGYRPAFPSAPH